MSKGVEAFRRPRQWALGAAISAVISIFTCLLWVGLGPARQTAGPSLASSVGRERWVAPRAPSGGARPRLQTAAKPAPGDPAGPGASQVSHRPGPKFSEPRVPFDSRQTPPIDGDSGPGPYIQVYQGRSGRLSSHALPHPDNSPDRTTSASKGPELVVWPESTRVAAGEQAVIHASLADGAGQRVPAELVEIQISAPGDEGPAASGSMTPSPAGSASQFDYAHRTAAIRAPASGKAPPPAEYRFVVRVRGKLGGQDFERAAGGFFLAESAGAKLDRAAVVDFQRGNLQLDVQLRVERPGTYFVSAELWGGPTGALPIAFARERLERLTPGIRHVTLMFGGKIIRDSGIDGPYVVRNVQLMQVDAVPPHESEPIDALPSTRAFDADDFY